MPDSAMNLVDAGKARASHAEYLRSLNELVEIARLPPEQQHSRLQRFSMPQLNLPSPLHLLQGMVGHKIVHRALDNLALLRCAVAALAAERYRREHQHWPDGLAALVPRFLREVPTDPYDGAPLRYKRLGDGIVIYALGPNGQDDGGNNLSRRDPATKGTDVGFRLWDAEHRAQPAPPIAAREKEPGP
jgi:hypothetical protein